MRHTQHYRAPCTPALIASTCAAADADSTCLRYARRRDVSSAPASARDTAASRAPRTSSSSACTHNSLHPVNSLLYVCFVEHQNNARHPLYLQSLHVLGFCSQMLMVPTQLLTCFLLRSSGTITCEHDQQAEQYTSKASFTSCAMAEASRVSASCARFTAPACSSALTRPFASRWATASLRSRCATNCTYIHMGAHVSYQMTTPHQAALCHPHLLLRCERGLQVTSALLIRVDLATQHIQLGLQCLHLGAGHARVAHKLSHLGTNHC